MLEGRDIKHKGLRALWVDDERSGLKPEWVKRAARILQALDAASAPDELKGVPGFGLHPLKGDAGPKDVNLEDYHGN